MRYPLWKLIVLLVLGPPAAAGYWYAYQDLQKVQFHLDGMVIIAVWMFVIWFLIPSVVCGSLATLTVYWIVSAYQKRRQKQSATLSDT